jgi:hypothetical protein
MIIIDLNSLVISNILQSSRIDIDSVRNIVLNMIRINVKKFRYEFSQKFGIVLVDDGKWPWRRDYFSFYKANRRRKKKLSSFNWEMIYTYLDQIKNEIFENLPMVYMKHEKCEADDIIATLAQFAALNYDEVLIISSDTDFSQLYSINIRQYCPVKKKFLNFHVSPTYDLLFKILYGDKTDGIPNYLTDDDYFVNNEKNEVQVSINRFNELVNIPYGEIESVLSEEERPGFVRNRTLIDFFYIPKNIQMEIFNLYKESLKQKKGKGLEITNKYFREHNLKTLLFSIGDFEA